MLGSGLFLDRVDEPGMSGRRRHTESASKGVRLSESKQTKNTDRRPRTEEERLIDILEVYAEETGRRGAPTRPLTSDERAAIWTNNKKKS